jgi:hypothetical protein
VCPSLSSSPLFSMLILYSWESAQLKKKKIDPMEICKETSADTSADSMKRQKL